MQRFGFKNTIFIHNFISLHQIYHIYKDISIISNKNALCFMHSCAKILSMEKSNDYFKQRNIECIRKIREVEKDLPHFIPEYLDRKSVV